MLKILSTQPKNYKQIDKYLSRSAQPLEENLRWLKEHGVTDIINLRNMSQDNFNEGQCVRELGMTYHSIPTVTKFINREEVGKILDIIEGVKLKGGRVNLHCMRGSDRTGMLSYIYERLNNIGSKTDNQAELRKHGWQKNKYPNLIQWAENIIDKISKETNKKV